MCIFTGASWSHTQRVLLPDPRSAAPRVSITRKQGGVSAQTAASTIINTDCF